MLCCGLRPAHPKKSAQRQARSDDERLEQAHPVLALKDVRGANPEFGAEHDNLGCHRLKGRANSARAAEEVHRGGEAHENNDSGAQDLARFIVHGDSSPFWEYSNAWATGRCHFELWDGLWESNVNRITADEPEF